MSTERITLNHLRGYAVARSLFEPTTLQRAIETLGFVQADPIRAPARAQDLTLRHRVTNYRAGDLERRYPRLEVEEDYFINYGFLPRRVQALLHPRSAMRARTPAGKRRAEAILDFIRERGWAHPREVDERFAHGTVANYWGGASSATTQLLDSMHYRGLLRVTRRDNGIRVYAAHEQARGPADATERRARLDALVDLVVRKYSPLPGATLGVVVRRLRYAAPQFARGIDAALARAKERLACERVDGVEWYWPAEEQPAGFRNRIDDHVRLLAPFDPIVWDRRRFELLWGWAYRFEAYNPPSKRRFGYYALPLLWRERVIGWANLAAKNGELASEVDYASRTPRERAFRRGLDAEMERMRSFLRL
ncbi:MAG TPA: crosslink repair DNA glycosylase YcaQ family protein [Casimicrobiaceae bacterium]|nr:crosslink repair DNA glycosylase YcaQ family protein [Casimicrobiaceae bacterium]